MTTRHSGLSFLSYRRSRIEEASLIIRAQLDHGIPTWQDVKNLGADQTEAELRRVLRDPNTANVVALLTPEVAESAIIRQVEVPEALHRVRNKDGFFLVPVAAGGLDYEEAANVAANKVSALDLKAWNMKRITGEKIDEVGAVDIAARVLSDRLKALHSALPEDEPVTLGLYVWRPPAAVPPEHLSLNWSGRFENKVASAAVWEGVLLPALRRISDAVRVNAPGREIIASGIPTLPAATALGCAFQAASGHRLGWSQWTRGQPNQTWSLDVTAENSGFEFAVEYGDANSMHVAVLVSVADDVEPLFAQAKETLPELRGYARVFRRGDYPHMISNPGQAVDIARTVQNAMRQLRRTFGSIDTVHLFMAVPAGLAVMIGQLLGTIGKVQTYEHVGTSGSGQYVAAALLEPCD